MALAKNDDLTRLWNQAYPEASTAPTNTLAKSQADVDAMSVRDRLWDSLDYTYGLQRQESDRSFRQANSQLNNAMLQRGMQRSSYGAANNANLAAKQIEAQNNIYGAQIADYEKALLQVEQQDEATRQFNAQMGSKWLQQIIANGGTPSKALLKQVGLSKADYNAMIQQIGDDGGGGGWDSGTAGGSGTRSGSNATNNRNNNTNPQQNAGGSAFDYETGAKTNDQFIKDTGGSYKKTTTSTATPKTNAYTPFQTSNGTKLTTGLKFPTDPLIKKPNLKMSL